MHGRHLVDDGAARRVDQIGGRLHATQRLVRVRVRARVRFRDRARVRFRDMVRARFRDRVRVRLRVKVRGLGLGFKP